jgi:hypothetical protein
MKDHFDTLKIWGMWVLGKFLVIAESAGDFASDIGAVLAVIYTIYKLFILHRDEKRKRNELD